MTGLMPSYLFVFILLILEKVGSKVTKRLILFIVKHRNSIVLL